MDGGARRLSPLALAAAVAAALGAVLILRADDGRTCVFGVALALLVAPLAVEPLPGLLALAFRVVAALLAAYLLYIAVRASTRLLVPTRLGGTTEAVFVALAFALGLLVPGAAPERAGPPALASALAVGLAGLDLLLFGQDSLRLGSGAILSVLGASLGYAWLTGPISDASQLAVASALLAAAVSTAWLSLNAYAVRGDLSLGTRARELRDRG